ncbi:MAG TPA: hypothetical protein VGH32_14220 [Pirellulales bacterium]
MDDNKTAEPGDEHSPRHRNAGESRDPEWAAARRERIEDHIRESLAKPDSLEACLGATNGELMQVAAGWKEGLDKMLASDPEAMFTNERYLDIYLRLHKQIGHYSGFEIELRRLKSQEDADAQEDGRRCNSRAAAKRRKK